MEIHLDPDDFKGKFQGCSKNPAEKALACEKCGLLLCESHTENKENFKKCPKCGAEPLQFRAEFNLRTFIANNYPARCTYCNKFMIKDKLNEHILNDCTKTPHCYLNGCKEIAQNQEDAFKHIKEKHGDMIWKNFQTTESKIVCIK